jgi:hypothetical protein
LSSRGRKQLESLEEASSKLGHPILGTYNAQIAGANIRQNSFTAKESKTQNERYDCFNK